MPLQAKRLLSRLYLWSIVPFALGVIAYAFISIDITRDDYRTAWQIHWLNNPAPELKGSTSGAWDIDAMEREFLAAAPQYKQDRETPIIWTSAAAMGIFLVLGIGLCKGATASNPEHGS